MANTIKTFWAPGPPRWVGAPFAAMGTFFFVTAACQLLGLTLITLEGNIWIGVFLGGIFAAVGWWLLLRGTCLVVDPSNRTYLAHTGLVILKKTRTGSWEDFGPLEVQREKRNGTKGRTFFVWSVRLQWKDPAHKPYELAAFTEGWNENDAQKRAERFAAEIATLLNRKVLDPSAANPTSSKISESSTDLGPLPAKSLIKILEEERSLLRLQWRPIRNLLTAIPLLILLLGLFAFTRGIMIVAKDSGHDFFASTHRPPLPFTLFFMAILSVIVLGLLTAMGFTFTSALFKMAGTVEATIDCETLTYKTCLFGKTLRTRTIALHDVTNVVLRELIHNRHAIVLETRTKNWKLMADIPETDRIWLLQKLRARILGRRPSPATTSTRKADG